MNDPVVWIVIALAVLALLALLAVVMRKRKHAEARHHAEELRQHATQHTPAVTESELEARKARAEAELAAAEARAAELRAEEASRGAAMTQAQQEHTLREADRLDPHVDHRSEDYQPELPGQAGHQEPGATGDEGTTGRRRLVD